MLHLWSYQAKETQSVLEAEGELRAKWEFVDESWQDSYLIMVEKMLSKGIDTQGSPPIWTFYVDQGIKEPTAGSARSLLSDLQIEQGQIVIELEVPKQKVLLSDYHLWCDIVGQSKSWIESYEEIEEMFNIDKFDFRDDEISIQGCLPLIDYAWVKDIRRLSIGVEVGELEWIEKI